MSTSTSSTSHLLPTAAAVAVAAGLVSSTACKLDGDIDDATAPLRHSLERALRVTYRRRSLGAELSCKKKKSRFFAGIFITILLAERRTERGFLFGFPLYSRAIEILSARLILYAHACMYIITHQSGFLRSLAPRISRGFAVFCHRTNLYKS